MAARSSPTAPPRSSSTAGARRARGLAAEALAAERLAQHGFVILERNFHARTGEVDLIADDGGTLCFIEVRARRSARFGRPEATVSAAKQRRIAAAARRYLARRAPPWPRCRFDVVGVLGPPGQEQVALIRGAFEEAP